MKANIQNRIKGLALRLFCVFAFFGEKRGFYGRANIRTINYFSRSLSIWFQRGCLRAFLLCGLALFPFLTFAEFDADDSQNLNLIRGWVQNIELDVDEIKDEFLSWDTRYLDSIKEDVDDTAYNSSMILKRMGYSSYSDPNITIHSDFEHLSSDLDAIHDNITELKDGITELELLNDKVQSIIDYLESSGGSGGSGGSGDTEINQNWLTEAKYTEIANQFLSSWGFEGGSSGTFKNSIDMMIGTQTSLPTSYTLTYYTAERDTFVPFPDTNPAPFNKNWWYTLNQHNMTFDLNEIGLFGMLNYNMQYMHLTLGGLSEALINNMKKQSWNDWQAHTNLVENIRLSNFMPSDSPNPDNIGTIDESSGILSLTFDNGTGDSPDEIDLTPSFTNDTNTLYENLGSITNKFEKMVVAQDIKNRYFRNYISEEQKHIDVVQMDKLNDKIDFFTYEGKTYSLEMSDNALSMYREIFSYDVLRNIRGFVYSFYVLLVGISCFWLFLKVGKI